MGCAEPTADVFAVWLEGTAPRFQIYDGGDRHVMPFETTVANADPSHMQLVAMPGGHGFVVLPPNDTMVWYDAREGGHAIVDADPRWGSLDPFVDDDVLESGLALTRRNAARTGFVILPTIRGSEGAIWFEHPDAFYTDVGGQIQFDFHAARDARILYAWPVGVTQPSTVVVYELHTRGLVELDRTELSWRPSGQGSAGLTMKACLDGACVSPSGASLLMMRLPATDCHDCLPTDPEYPNCLPLCPPRRDCRVLRYRWADDVPITSVFLPEDCDGNDENADGPPEMIAALSDSIVLLEDQLRIYRADLDAGTWQSVPKLGMAMTLHPALRGGAAVLVADNLQVIRADEQGIRIMSPEQTVCEGGHDDDTKVSPNGEWVIAACAKTATDVVGQSKKQAPTIVRISPFGAEHFDGIAMRPLGIDDLGNALLYSYAAGDSDQEPRGLFVLDAKGHLARIDALEPAPLKLVDGTTYYYFAAEPLDD
jgi:hypothetical protein